MKQQFAVVAGDLLKYTNAEKPRCKTSNEKCLFRAIKRQRERKSQTDRQIETERGGERERKGERGREGGGRRRESEREIER